MKNWRLTTAITLTAVATAALAYLYANDEAKSKESEASKPAATETKPAEMNWDFLPEIVASYGDKKISREDLVNVIKEITKSFPGASQESVNPDIIKAIAPKLVESMIDKKILLDMAEAEGIKPSAELVIKEFDDMLKTVPQDKIEEFKNALQARGTNMETYSKDLSKSVLAQEDAAINSWVKGKIMSNIKVSEEETKKYYDEHQEAFTTPESVNASHILIKSKSDSAEDMEAAKKRCVEIKADIDKGTSTFEKAAEDFSDCPSGKSAKGSLGEFGRGDMIKEFEDVAFGMKEGSISEPVKTIYGYHIIKLVGHKDKSVKAYADVSNMITEYLKQQQVEKNVKDILDKKKVELNVKINLPEQAAPALPVQVPATP